MAKRSFAGDIPICGPPRQLTLLAADTIEGGTLKYQTGQGLAAALFRQLSRIDSIELLEVFDDNW